MYQTAPINNSNMSSTDGHQQQQANSDLFLTSPLPPEWLKDVYREYARVYGPGSVATAAGTGRLLEAIRLAAVKKSSGQEGRDIFTSIVDGLNDVVVSVYEALAFDRWYCQMDDRSIYTPELIANNLRVDGNGAMAYGGERSYTLICDSTTSQVHCFNIRRMLIGIIFSRRRRRPSSPYVRDDYWDSRDAYERVMYGFLMPINNARVFGITELVNSNREDSSLNAARKHSSEEFSYIMLHRLSDFAEYVEKQEREKARWSWRAAWSALIFFRAYNALADIIELARRNRPKSVVLYSGNNNNNNNIPVGQLVFNALDNTSRLVEAYNVANRLERLSEREYWQALSDTAYAINVHKLPIPPRRALERYFEKSRIAGRAINWLARIYEGKLLGIRDDGS